MGARDKAKNLLAVALGFGLLLLLEAALAALGVTPLAREDLFVGFEGSSPLFVKGQGEQAGRFVLNPAKRPYFNEQSFPMPKPDGTVRIVSFGGSTTYGQPFINNTSFPAWTARVLGRYDVGHAYENINAGGISYASYRVLRLMEELAEFSPDLYVVYAGHNEFLERRTFGNLLAENAVARRMRAALHQSRIYSLAFRGVEKAKRRIASSSRTVLGDGVSAMLEEVAGPELYHRDVAFREGVIREYRRNLEAMVRLSRAKGIPLVFCTLPSNLSGVSPFKSEHRVGLTVAELAAWDEAFAAGALALEAGRFPEAIAFLREAERVDATYAQLHFFLGEALTALGRTAEAYAAYDRAKEEDIIPLRALDAFNDAIREVSRQEGVALADVEVLFRRWSPGGIPGPSLFLDHVHPTLEGQQAVALLVVDAAVEAGLVPLSKEVWRSNRGEAPHYLKARLEEVSERYRAMGLWVVGRTYNWGGKYPEALHYLREAWKTVKDIGEIPHQIGVLEMRAGRYAEALPFLREAEHLDPGDRRISFMKALALNGQNRGGEALEVLDRLNPIPAGEQSAYHAARADALRLLGDRAAARNELEVAVRLASAPGHRAELANAYARLGDPKTAEGQYREFLRLTGHPDPERALSDWRKRTSWPESRGATSP